MNEDHQRDVLSERDCFYMGALAERNGFRRNFWLALLVWVRPPRSIRLPSPWRSLSDDLTLVVRDDRGRYGVILGLAGASFGMPKKSGRSLDVSYAVPLKGIFFLLRHKRIKPSELARTGYRYAI